MSQRINEQEEQCYRTECYKARVHRASGRQEPFPPRPRSPLARAEPLPGRSGGRGGLCGPRGRCSGPSPALPRAAGVVGARGQICAWPEGVRWRHSPSSARPCVHYALPERGLHGGTGNAPRAAFDVFLGFWSFPPSLNNWICKHDGLCFPELVLCLFFWPHLTEQHIKATEHQESCCLGKFCGKCPGGLGAGRALLSLS
uniref:uncharacterized protein LOC106994874 n=1 Tax=Macaca mulatta TaxID=9544 RepID=UPI0010A1FA4A|nr:uncharacterized protein LOC106994874 [Macaca mulatta]